MQSSHSNMTKKQTATPSSSEISWLLLVKLTSCGPCMEAPLEEDEPATEVYQENKYYHDGDMPILQQVSSEDSVHSSIPCERQGTNLSFASFSEVNKHTSVPWVRGSHVSFASIRSFRQQQQQRYPYQYYQ
jgi:hypothetical protein